MSIHAVQDTSSSIGNNVIPSQRSSATCRFCHHPDPDTEYNTLAIHTVCLPLLEQASQEMCTAIKALEDYRMHFKFEWAFEEVETQLKDRYVGMPMKDFSDKNGLDSLKKLFNKTAPCKRLYYEIHHNEIWMQASMRQANLS